MKKYIFITSEGFTYQPGSESAEPDVENLQVVGFADGNYPEEAVMRLLDENDCIRGTSFDEVTAIEVKSDKGTVHSLRDLCMRKALP